MQLLIFAVKDRATDSFAQPMFLQTRNQAIRLFIDEVNRPAQDNPLNKHPDDYDIYEIGSYDQETAIITPRTAEIVMRGKDAIQIKGA